MMESHMKTVSVKQAGENLYKLMDEVNKSRKPIVITSEIGNAVLVAEEDWRAIQESLYLLSVSGMRESIQEGLKTSVKECSEDLDW